MYRVTLVADTCLRAFLVDLQAIVKTEYRDNLEKSVARDGWLVGAVVKVPNDLLAYETDRLPVIENHLRGKELLDEVCGDARTLLEGVTGAYVH